MAKKSKSAKSPAKAGVETYKHKEAKRKNIPTAENQKLIADDDKATKTLHWPRNPDLDPQLVWRGKDFESDPLEVETPPIYIQEKFSRAQSSRIYGGGRRIASPTTRRSLRSSTNLMVSRKAGRKTRPRAITTTMVTGRTG